MALETDPLDNLLTLDALEKNLTIAAHNCLSLHFRLSQWRQDFFRRELLVKMNNQLYHVPTCPHYHIPIRRLVILTDVLRYFGREWTLLTTFCYRLDIQDKYVLKMSRFLYRVTSPLCDRPVEVAMRNLRVGCLTAIRFTIIQPL